MSNSSSKSTFQKFNPRNISSDRQSGSHTKLFNGISKKMPDINQFKHFKGPPKHNTRQKLPIDANDYKSSVQMQSQMFNDYLR